MSERRNGRFYLGRVGVDSGQVMIGDPCYLDKYGKKSSNGFEFVDAEVDAQQASGEYDYSYSGACAATLSDNGAGQLGTGSAVSVSSGYGDGVYPVFGTYNEDGRIIKVEVLFDGGDDPTEGDEE